ncbi:hypothetical protein TTHERM_001071479 (macronuclear) [Tetrahymena thermophila SB210]|uniref:Uncharacterized protein n=1 Tax=Tetrahymena thermophila (strain SB210) TaxID=312017 RepID=W7X051_TETTS|nr:hypothetical protein TTHERM_001071479 [Tetrahymena thermophila SB210]EWS71242.1 hypothetical protein TTHERM_001071479 [Tetrahymena thermophila SB210]|eukprot:XP_012656230.1 hypothetical protein TTHERM_001071479 [Tetrahymena thermophila SB210]
MQNSCQGEQSLLGNALEFYIEQNEAEDFQNFYVNILFNNPPQNFNQVQIQELYEQQNQNTQRVSSVAQSDYQKCEKESEKEEQSLNQSSLLFSYNIKINQTIQNASPERKSHFSINSIKSYNSARCSVKSRKNSLNLILKSQREQSSQSNRQLNYSNLRQKKQGNIKISDIFQNDKNSQEISPTRLIREKIKFQSPYNTMWIEKTLEKSFNIKLQFEKDPDFAYNGVKPRCKAFKISKKGYGISPSKESNQKLSNQNQETKEDVLIKENILNNQDLYNFYQNQKQIKNVLINNLF